MGVDGTPSLWRIHRTIGMGGDKLVAEVAGDRVEEEHGDALRGEWERNYAEVEEEVHGLPGAAAHLGALDRARVVGRCGCGCASVDFAVDGRRPPHGATYEVLADYQWRDAAGCLGGVFAFARGGVLAGLEVWSVDGEADTTRLPAPDALEPLGTPPPVAG